MEAVDEGCENAVAPHDAMGLAVRFLRPQAINTFYDAS